MRRFDPAVAFSTALELDLFDVDPARVLGDPRSGWIRSLGFTVRVEARALVLDGDPVSGMLLKYICSSSQYICSTYILRAVKSESEM